jgi:hypothetical protein
VNSRKIGSMTSVSVGARDLEAFRRTWPASGLDKLRMYRVVFDDGGDVVDETVNGERSDAFDGDALKAVADDLRQFATADVVPGWLASRRR